MDDKIDMITDRQGKYIEAIMWDRHMHEARGAFAQIGRNLSKAEAGQLIEALLDRENEEDVICEWLDNKRSVVLASTS